MTKYVPYDVHTPWNPYFVRLMNFHQHRGLFHPYTCGNDSRHRVLFATEDGWICPDCSYTQTVATMPPIFLEAGNEWL